MTFIGLDLGTSFIKGAVLDLEKSILKDIHRLPFPSPVDSLPELHYEINPQQIVDTAKTLLTKLLALAPNCEGVVICSQMHGLILTSPEGYPLSNCITWQDQRVLEIATADQSTYFDQINDRLTTEDKHLLGNELKPSLPLCTLYWLRENNLLPQEPYIPASLPDFLLAHLSATTTGIASPPKSELTHAGAHGGLNLETCDWHWAAFNRLGLTNLTLPRIVPLGNVVSTIEIEGQRLPCYTPVGDHQCALVGAFLEVGDLSLNIATASQVSMLTDSLSLGEAYQTRPFFDDQFLNTVIRIPAGRSLDALIGVLSELALAQGVVLDNPWPTIVEAVEKTTKTDLTIDLSFFASAVGNVGHIGHIREDQLTVGHLFKAAFSHMAANYYQCAQRLSTLDEWQQIVFSGGLVQKIKPLQETITAQFNLPYRFCASEEDTLLGLLALAMVFSGRKSSVSEAIQHLSQQTSTRG